MNEKPTGRLRWRKATLPDLDNTAVMKAYSLGDGGYILQQEWEIAPERQDRMLGNHFHAEARYEYVYEWRDVPTA